MLLDGVDERDGVHRLGDVAVEACGQEPLAIPIHRLRGQGEHRDGGGALVRAQPAQPLDAIDVRQLDIHEHEIGSMLGCQLHRPHAGRCFEGAVPPRLEDIPEQLHVLLVVLDHEDLLTRHD